MGDINKFRVEWARGIEDSRGERGRCGHLVAKGHKFYGGSCWDCMDRDERALLDSVGGDLSKLPNSRPARVAMPQDDECSEEIVHGSQCDLSSRQADWCERCQIEWQAGAHVRFLRGIGIIYGSVLTPPH